MANVNMASRHQCPRAGQIFGGPVSFAYTESRGVGAGGPRGEIAPQLNGMDMPVPPQSFG